MQDNTNQGVAEPSVPQQPVSPPTAATPAPLSSHPQREMINAGEEINDPPKKSRKLLFMVLGLILLVAVLGGLFVYRTLFGAKVLDENMIISQTPTSIASPESDNASEWNNYKTTHFSIKYPKGWAISEQNETYLELVKEAGPLNEVTQKNASIIISSSTDDLNYAGCANPYDTTHNINIDGKELTYGLQFQDLQFAGSVTDDLNTCWFTLDGVNFGIHTYSSVDNTAEMLQILSTFEFGENTALSICAKGYLFYENEQYSICYPNNMNFTINEIAQPDQSDIVNTRVVFENVYEKFTINTSFVGGWGGGTCRHENRTIAGESSLVLTWNADEQTPCSTNLTNMVAVVGNGVYEGALPIAIDYQRNGERYLDDTTFETVINSLEIK